MLNGLDPVLIFQFSKKILDLGAVETLSRMPLVSIIPTFVDQPPIPIYLSESLTGVYIDDEGKNVDIETDTQTLTDGTAPDVKQKGISSIIDIGLLAKKGSIGITLISALIDVLYEKVSSDEYSISYLHGPITIFRGKLTSFQINQTPDNDLLRIRFELSRGSKNPTVETKNPVVPGERGEVPIE